MAVRLPVITEYDNKGISAAIGDLKKLGKQQLLGVVSAGALVDAARRSIQAANEDARSQRLLANTLQNTTGATNDQVAAVEANLQKLQYSAAVADDELRPALQKLLQATRDTGKAQDLLATALDISATTGRDVETVALSLSRAYQGNIGALRRLGLRVSDTAVKSKDFQMAMEEIRPVVDGAAEAAAKGADGGWKRLGIALGDISEVVGTELNNALGPAVSNLGKAAQAATAAGESGSFLGNATKVVIAELIKATAGLGLFGGAAKSAKKDTDDLGASVNVTAGRFRMLEEANKRAYSDLQAKRQEEAAKRSKGLKEKTDALAKANKERLATALTTARQRLEQLTQASQDYSDSIRDSITGAISLSDAVARATDTEQAYNDALAERRDAYAELAKLQAVTFDAATGKTQVADAEDLAAAMERVAKAEGAVVEAQGKRVDYTAAFREQINAAKDFAGSLQTLIGQGLKQTGLQQLLNLGPVAGAQVAKDLVAGTAGLSVSDLNMDALTAAAAGVGGAAAGQMFGADIAGAQNTLGAVTYANDIKITVTSADPDAVVRALVAWSKKNGKLPASIRVD
jgi:hypothetical protein